MIIKITPNLQKPTLLLTASTSSKVMVVVMVMVLVSSGSIFGSTANAVCLFAGSSLIAFPR